MTAPPGSSARAPDWTRSPARPIGALVLGALLLCALPTAFSRESVSRPAHPSATLDTRLDLNAATVEELIMLPGIGEARARAILDHRKAHGPFDSIEALDAVKGFGQRTIDALRPFLTVSPHANPAP
jgi:competence ComEA-like helix-hairpin-helix protein